jgi:hypothetical protein
MKKSLFMKRTVCMFVLTFAMLASALAQAPQAFTFQAVVRDKDGNLASEKEMTVTLDILRGSSTGASVYRETFTARTDQAGVLSLSAGKGTPVSGKFSTINWKEGTFYVKTSIRLSGDTQTYDMGTLQLLSVPYALYAETSGGGSSGSGDGSWESESEDTPGQPVINNTYTYKTVHIKNQNGKDNVTLSPTVNSLDAGYVAVNANGDVKAVITSVNRYGILYLYDQQGEPRIILEADQNNGFVAVESKDGTTAVLQSSSVTGYNTKDEPSFRLYTTSGGGGALRLFDEDRVNSIHLGSNEINNEGGGLWTYNNSKRLVAISAMIEAPTHGGIDVNDENGRKGLFVAGPNGDGELFLFGPNGNNNVYIGGADEDVNTGGIWTKNRNGGDLVGITHVSGSPSNGAIAVYDATGLKGLFGVTSNGKSRLQIDEIYNNRGVSLTSATADYSLLTRSNSGADPCYVTETGDRQIVVRGTATLQKGSYTVTLPAEAASKIQEQTLTIQLTPRSAASKGLAIVDSRAGSFTVAELMSGDGSYAFDWTLTALRRDDPELRSSALEMMGAGSSADRADKPVELAGPSAETEVNTPAPRALEQLLQEGEK